MTLCFSISVLSWSCDSLGAWAVRGDPEGLQTFPGRLTPEESDVVILKRWQYKMPLDKVPTKAITAVHSTLKGVALTRLVSSGLAQLTFLLVLSLQSLCEVN